MNTANRMEVALWEAARHARALDEALSDRDFGERLVPATLAALVEPLEDWSMRDRLNRLEKLGYLNVDAWLGRRDIRNRLAHEYPEAPASRFALLAQAVQATRELVGAYRLWQSKLSGAGLADGQSPDNP